MVTNGIVPDELILTQKKQKNANNRISKFGRYTSQFMIMPTYNCNMLCEYCFAESNNNRYNMSKETADKIIHEIRVNELLRKTILQDDYTTEVHFTGGGEPTYNIEILKYIVESLKDISGHIKYTIQTNGLMNKETLDYLIKCFEMISISFDFYMQDSARKTANGEMSSKLILSIIEKLKDYSGFLQLRCCVCDDNIGKLYNIVDKFLYEHSYIDRVQLEPINLYAGRAANSSLRTPDTDDFVQCYTKLKDKYKERIICSLDKHQRTDSFCGIINGKIPVYLPSGNISRCQEIDDYSDINNVVICNKKDIIVYNHKKEKPDKCMKCYLYNICAGGCRNRIYKDHAGNMSSEGEYFCNITKKIFLENIKRIIITSPDMTIDGVSIWKY